MNNKALLSRRKFLTRIALLGVASLLAIGSTPILLRQWKALKSLKLSAQHTVSYLGADSISPSVLRGSAYFSAFLAGIQPDASDIEELTNWFEFASSKDGNYYAELVYLVDHVNEISRRKFNKSFDKIDSSESDALVELVMRSNHSSGLKSKFLALVSAKERASRLMHASTIPFAYRVYANSGVPWKRRGYTTWPGVPGDTFGYTKPIDLSSC